MSNKDCSICLEYINNKTFVSCSCNTFICDECMEMYINSSKPKIPNCTLCRNEYLYSSFQNSSILYKYLGSLHAFLSRLPIFIEMMNSILVDKKINLMNEEIEIYLKNEMENINLQNEVIVKDLRESRRIFNNKFPEGIKAIFSISKTMNKKYENILEKNCKKYKENAMKENAMKETIMRENVVKEAERMKEKKYTKNCSNGFCKGLLYINGNSEEQCNICLSIFCDLCLQVKNEGHVCKKEDIESIHFMKRFVKCPAGCGTSIEKISGCDAVICGVCNTSFNYRTLEKEYHGGGDKKFKLKGEYCLSKTLEGKRYQKRIIDEVVLLENGLTNENNKINNIKFLTDSFPEELNDDCILFFNEYSDYKIKLLINKKIAEKLTMLNKLYVDEKLNVDTLMQVLRGN